MWPRRDNAVMECCVVREDDCIMGCSMASEVEGREGVSGEPILEDEHRILLYPPPL